MSFFKVQKFKIQQNNLLFKLKSVSSEEIANDRIFGLIHRCNENKKINH